MLSTPSQVDAHLALPLLRHSYHRLAMPLHFFSSRCFAFAELLVTVQCHCVTIRYLVLHLRCETILCLEVPCHGYSYRSHSFAPLRLTTPRFAIAVQCRTYPRFAFALRGPSSPSFAVTLQTNAIPLHLTAKLFHRISIKFSELLCRCSSVPCYAIAKPYCSSPFHAIAVPGEPIQGQAIAPSGKPSVKEDSPDLFPGEPAFARIAPLPKPTQLAVV